MRRGSANGKTFTVGLSHTDDVGELFRCGCRFLERRILIRGELDLGDLFHAPRIKLDRHADKQIADAVLVLQQHRARNNLLLVLQKAMLVIGD
jgi:hypothetical protein